MKSHTKSLQPPPSAALYIPPRKTLATLAAAARGCRGCDLYRHATQTVFGEGPRTAELMLIGEQPGDAEDREGRPFVGPAGRVLDRALAQAGISREKVYLTNAVKHFKWEPRGKRRLHKRPDDDEVRACTPWLVAELAAVKPRIVVCLGVTAARAMFGHAVRLKDCRGRIVPTPRHPNTFVTLHPAAVLRLREPSAREAELAVLVNDLRRARDKAENAT